MTNITFLLLLELLTSTEPTVDVVRQPCFSAELEEERLLEGFDPRTFVVGTTVVCTFLILETV